MTLEEFRMYCLSLPHATEDTPFGETILVFRIGNKIFAMTDIENFPFKCSLKCDPERSVELRERYEEIVPGWHLNKKHWITVEPGSTLPESLIRELVRHSYELVFASLKRKDREILSLQ
jgi:predicted DNA-binding protein (MmcQ/YjbR family)